MWQNVLIMLGYRIQNFFAGWGEGERNLRVNFVCQGGLETYFCNLTMWFWEVRIFQGFWLGGGGWHHDLLDPLTPPNPSPRLIRACFKPSVWISSSIILDHVGLILIWCHWGHLHCKRSLTQWMVIQFQNPINLLFQYIKAFIG